MPAELKGDSPFYPGQPVPVDSFVGREAEIERILQRGVGQTARGKPTAFFVQGEFGIGKSSVAEYLLRVAEERHKLLGLYAALGGCRTLTDLAGAVLAAVVRSGVYDPTWREQVRNWLAKYVGKTDLFGFRVDLEAIRADAPKLAAHGAVLDFLQEVLARYKKVRDGAGVFLVLDEVNGIAANADFAFFLKSLIDTNAVVFRPPVPLLLLLCGAEDRRRELIRAHPPTDRLFDVVDILPLSDAEVGSFFTAAFGSVGLSIRADAMRRLVAASAGQPKVMHLVGDRVFWRAKSGRAIDLATVTQGVHDAADELDTRYIDPQVSAVLLSQDTQTVVRKLASELGPRMGEFTRKSLSAKLTPTEAKQLGNLLAKLKKLNVLQTGETRGSYQFRIHMVQMYLWLRSLEA